MKDYTDNKLFNDMANMVDQLEAKPCDVPGCDNKTSTKYTDYCFTHEKEIEDARDQWDTERDYDLD